MLRRLEKVVLVLLYGCATLQFVRYYCKTTDFYLNMSAYLTGHERLPFQERVLPIFFLRPMYNSRWLMERMAHSNGAFTPGLGPVYVISLLSILIAGIYTQKLYGLVTSRRTLSFLVYPIFLFAVMWSYAIHSEADFSYPYDLPSLAFFAAGLYYIYKRSYWGIFVVVLVGTFNRETTLFLIVIYVLDSASRTVLAARSKLEGDLLSARGNLLLGRFDLRLVSWTKVAALGTVWVSIKLFLAHRYANNSTAEDFLRIGYNLERLSVRLLPAMLNICGYTLPLVVIFSSRIRNVRYQNYLLVLLVWFPIMFCSGVLLETRIYGELCSFAAVALVLIAEESVTQVRQSAVEEQRETREQVAA